MQRYGIIVLITWFIWLALNTDSTYGCDCDYPDPNAEIVVGEGENEERFKEIVVCIGSEVNFSGSNSSDPDGTTLSYSWSLGDGADPNSEVDSEDTSTRYDSSGIKTVTLTVTDNDRPDCCGTGANCTDRSDTDTVKVTVVEGGG